MNLKKVLLLSMIGMMSITHKCVAQPNKKAILTQKINHIIAHSNGKVGVAIKGLDFKDSLLIHGNDHYPMQSVFKFPLALFVLHKVDKGELAIQQKIHVKKERLDTATWSPLVKDFPNQDLDISVADLLNYSVSKSDNNACDILFDIVGGPRPTNDFIHQLGVSKIAIVANEAGMKNDWNVQYTNWCTPFAMLQLLDLFDHQKVLSKNSNSFLLQLMTKSENPTKRIKGLLPENAIVAHKTGTSDTNKEGLTAATNDVGIITLPNGKHLAMVVYVSDFKGGTEAGEHTIAGIAKLVWDYYSVK